MFSFKQSAHRIQQIIAASVLAAIFAALPAMADIKDMTISTGCDTLPSYNGRISLAVDGYDIYIKLARRGEQANIKGYAQIPGNTGSCKYLGEVRANGDKWTRVGEFYAFANQEYILQASSNSLQNQPNANRPAYLVLPKRNPVCIPDDECEVTVNGIKGTLLPASTPLNRDSLRILRAEPLDDLGISKVSYYAAGKLSYSSTEFADFDMRYVAYPGMQLTRVIEYTNGQKVIMDDVAPDNHIDQVSNFFFRASRSYPWSLKLMMFTGLTLVILAAFRLLTGFIRERQYNRYAHGLLKLNSHIKPTANRPTSFHHGRYGRLLIVSVKATFVFVGIVMLVLVLNNYAARIYTVDGESMQPTLYAKDRLIVNQLPVTLAHLNGREYIPKRGEIIVVRAAFGQKINGDNTEDSAIPYLVKRVVGLPGERLVIKDGVMTVYNTKFPDGFNVDAKSGWAKSYTPSSAEEYIDIRLGERELFITGDNRPKSIDSRLNGALDANEIIGPAYKIFGSSDRPQEKLRLE